MSRKQWKLVLFLLQLQMICHHGQSPLWKIRVLGEKKPNKLLILKTFRRRTCNFSVTFRPVSLRWYCWEKECQIDIATECTTLNNIVACFNAHFFSSSWESLFIKSENRKYTHLSRIKKSGSAECWAGFV